LEPQAQAVVVAVLKTLRRYPGVLAVELQATDPEPAALQVRVIAAAQAATM
jgi:hypothetical protein